MIRRSKITVLVALVLTAVFMLSACGTDPYTEYAAAYNKLAANGGIDANIRLTLEMDGTTQYYAGNFKVDNRKDMIYYEMESMEGKTIQFSDGNYLYIIQGDNKLKYSLKDDGGNGDGPTEPQAPEGEEQTAPTFETSGFLGDFASMLEAGKIKELGLLSPIERAAVTKTTKNGDVYTLEVSDAIVKKFLNTMAEDQAGTSDTIQVSDLKDFKYTATIKNGVVTANTYSCSVTVKVPGSLMSDGNAVSYKLSLSIKVEYNNPGQAVSITLPSTEGYQEIQGL